MTRDLINPVALAALACLGLASPALAQDRDARERIAALSSPEPVERAMAACELGRMRAAAEVRPAREALLALIGDDTPVDSDLCRDWRNGRGPDEANSPGREAAMALEELGTGILPELTELLEDSRPAAREQAAWALGMIDSAAAVESLIQTLADREPRVREQVAWALGMIEAAGAAEAIADALERETDDDVRRQLVWALGRVIDSADLDIEPSALAAVLRRALLDRDR